MAASRASVAKATAAKPDVVIATPDFVISTDELNELVRPFVAQVGEKILTLRSVNTFSLPEMAEIAELSDDDPAAVMQTISDDDETREFFEGAGAVIIMRIMEAWFASVQASRGESDSSTS